MEIKAFKDLTTTELYEIMKLRSQIFVVEQNCVYQDLDDKDYKSWHLMQWEGDCLVTYLRILPKGLHFDEVAIGRVISHPDYRGNGLSRNALLKAIQFIKSTLKETQVRISAQAHLKNFYESIGFVGVSDHYDEDGIPHIEMLYGHTPKALVVIDVQEAMRSCWGGVYNVEEVVANIQSLINTARKNTVPVIFVQHSESDGEFVRKSETWQICKEIEPKADEQVFEKFYSDAFNGTGLGDYLRSQGISQLMIVGMQTEYCMDTTIRNGFSRGFTQKTVEGCHSTYSYEAMTAQQVIQYHEFLWNNRFLEILSFESALDWLI